MSIKGKYINVGVSPICEQQKKDCNRIISWKCALLTDTHFEKPCPFYKKNEPEKEGK